MANQRALNRPKTFPAFFGTGDVAPARTENAGRCRADVRSSAS